MKALKPLAFLALVLSLLTASSLVASTPEQDKAFVEAYKKAFEAKDEKALMAFLSSKGADPMVLEFYSMMMTEGAGSKITSIELLDLTPEEAKEAGEAKEGPGGNNVKFPIKPTKRLVIKITDGSNTSTSRVFVDESNGKLVIPVPAPVK